MDVLDESDLWDPSSIFDENSEQNNQVLQNREKEEEEEEEEERQLDELGTMFFEWLKNNKEHISAEDMRSIKIKRSTVESASKRLGSSKEGKKQLLKLILEWVEKYQLQKKTNGETLPSTQFLDPLQNHNPNPNLTDPNPSFPPPPSWIPPPPYDPTAGFYIEDSYSNITNFQNYPPPHTQPTPPVSADYRQMMEPGTNSWPPSQFMMTYNQFPDTPDTINPNSVGFYSDQYPYPYQHQVFGENGERLGSSATKEARKKRMARQRRSQWTSSRWW